MIKKFFCIILILFFMFPCAFAKETRKLRANVQTEFALEKQADELTFITYEEINYNDIQIPKGAVIYLKNLQAQRPLRWHKGGLILCLVTKYSPDEFSDEIIDISDKELYLVARKYEQINKKEVSILATEIILAQGASFFAPGVDILYFFTKGAIIGRENKSRLRAGVENVYENSICWFWLKGKPIDLSLGDEVNLKIRSEEDASNLKKKMVKRKFREDMQALKRDLRREFKVIKKAELKEIKEIKKMEKEEKKYAKYNNNNEEYAKEENSDVVGENEEEYENYEAAAKIK